MSNIQGQRDGTTPIEAVLFTAHRDPLFQTTLLNVTTPATHAIPTTVHNYGPRGAGRLGIVVGGSSVVPAFNLTFVIKDIDGLIIGSNVTQTIPETPLGTTVLTPLNLTQQQILRGQTISFTGDVVLAALGTKLIVKLAEQSPEQEVSVSGDGIATEVTLAAIKTLADTTGLKILPADVTALKAVTEASAASIDGHVHSIDGKVPALGQALAASSVPVVLTALQVAELKVVGGGSTLTNASGASGANLLAAHGTLKHRIWKLFIRAGANTSVTLGDSAGVFGTDASGNCVVDLNPIGSVQGTAATAITLTTGDASAWTATVIHSAE
jgi:hypothetical protein